MEDKISQTIFCGDGNVSEDEAGNDGEGQVEIAIEQTNN